MVLDAPGASEGAYWASMSMLRGRAVGAGDILTNKKTRLGRVRSAETWSYGEEVQRLVRSLVCKT
jgi:hypothetical protein